MNKQLERRAWALDRIALEQRADDGKDTRTITGHAAVFNSPSEDLGGFIEDIAPGAFRDAIKSDDIRALFNHDANFVLGRNTAGTLRLKEDEKGLAIEIDPPETQVARDLIVSIERGDVDQMSFGFIAEEERWNWDEDTPRRTLVRVRLFDVSPVTFPAYPATSVNVRSIDDVLAAGKAKLVPAGEAIATPVIPRSVRDRALSLTERML